MSEEEYEKNQIPTKKASSSEQANFDPPQKKWRIVDLAEAQESRGGSRRDQNTAYKRGSRLSFKGAIGGIFNLLLVFGLGTVIYFGWVYYRNNYSGSLPFGEKKDAASDIEESEQDPAKDLGEQVEEIKDLLIPDSATTTDLPEVIEEPKTFLKVLDNGLGYLNIRNSPSLSGQIIDKAKPGDVYEYVAITDNWYNIVLKDLTEGAPTDGWVNGGYVEVVKGDINEDREPLNTTSSISNKTSLLKITSTPTGYLNVRNSPWGAIIGKVSPGDEYEYTDSKDNWYFVVIIDEDGDDSSGWVFGDYVDKL